MSYKVLAYYSLSPLANPHEEVLRHKEFFKTRDFKGRIYISEQGINGQASGLDEDADAYIARQLRYDPDLWVLEIDDREGRHPFDERIL